LVGIGGAGKTAIAERFLNELLDVGQVSNLPSNKEKADYKSAPLPPPHSVFVYSFYKDDKPENFFRHLQIWLEGTSAPDKQKSHTQLMFDIQQHQGLIILDGLEQVQESGPRGGFGRLTSPSLRDLLNHIACGSAREISVLVTSRFPLTDLRDSQPRFFHTIAVDQIDVAAGVALLQDRGVRGNDVVLAPIVEHCGRHALTIDLAGGYIKEYGHGDPTTPLNLATAEELQAEAEQEPDDDKWAVLKQGIRFARIAQRYREAMLSSDEATLALLERICLFRLGVDCETLAAIFTGPAAEKVSGKALAGLDADQLQKKLDWLVRMRIVGKFESSSANTENRTPKTLYNIHPAVRDGFLSGIGQEAAVASHEAVRKGLEVSLGGQSGTNPSDPATLDLLEEIIYHSLMAGRTEEAWEIYEKRMGGYSNLGRTLGAYQRGARICRGFASDRAPKDACLPAALDKVRLFNHWGLYLKNLGQLVAAAQCFEGVLEQRMRDISFGYYGKVNVAVAQRNLAEVLLILGRLTRAHSACDNAVEIDEWSQKSFAEDRFANHYACRGHARHLLGDIHGALVDFEEALGWHNFDFNRDVRGGFPHNEPGPLVGHAGVWQVMLLEKLGVHEQAKQLARANKAQFQTDLQVLPRWNLLLFSITRSQEASAADRALLDDAYNVAITQDAKELVCWAQLQRARIALTGDRGQKPELQVEEILPRLTAAEDALEDGLRIARDYGYSLYHIDLLLERAWLHLLQGDAGAALEDTELALDTGIPANHETGQVELLAANREECGYAWAIPAGLQLRAEALLLRAAQTIRQESYVPAKISKLPADVVALIDQAKQHLHDALGRWHDLRDPEPTEDNNFQLDGKEYNYRAAGTHQVLVQLEGGMLTRYPIRLTPSGELFRRWLERRGPQQAPAPAVRVDTGGRVSLRNRIYEEALDLYDHSQDKGFRMKNKDSTQKHNMAAVYELVRTALTDEELHDVCFMYFYGVYDEFTSGQTRGERLRLLIHYVSKQQEFDKLVEAVKEKNRKAFDAYERLLDMAPTVVSSPPGKPDALVPPTIGIITALPHEYVAVKTLLLNGTALRIPGEGAGKEYWLADVPSLRGGMHRVALCLLLDMGNTSAAVSATLLLAHFQTVETILMVGIAGGIPHPMKADEHVRLGDIVVSDRKGVIQYDFDKETANATEIRAAPRPPSARLLEAVRLLRAGELTGRRPWERYIQLSLQQLKWRQPPLTTDVLFRTQDPSCRLQHPPGSRRLRGKPRVFLGPIASANKLLKNPVKRDALRDQFGVKAVEMEGSGVADATWTHEGGYLVVRGVCDYCDSTKGDAWQNYAAAVAAAYSRALLESMPIEL
jgi:nucleoside phosphorylase